MNSVQNSTWIVTLAFCGQILSHKSRASYPVWGKRELGVRESSLSPAHFLLGWPGCLLLPWQMSQCEPLLETALTPGAAIMLCCLWGPQMYLRCLWAGMAHLWGTVCFVDISEGAGQEESGYKGFCVEWSLLSSEDETVMVPLQSSTSITLPCKPGPKIWQNQGCKREELEGCKDAWSDWVCTHFCVHPELHNSCFGGLGSSRVINFLCLFSSIHWEKDAVSDGLLTTWESLPMGGFPARPRPAE